MDYETNLIVENGIEVPESVLLKLDRGNRYGSVPGLDDNELADPNELERQVFQQEFGPVLSLPIKQNRSSLRPELDESGNIDWGAFGTIDFERYSNTFNKARYKADKLNEHLKDIKIMISIINDRILTI